MWLIWWIETDRADFVIVAVSGSNNFKFADGVDALALGYGQTKASKL